MVKSRIKGVARRESYRRDREQISFTRGEGKTERVAYLALVEDANGGTTTAHDLGVVLVDGALGVTDGGHVLDDDDVIRVLTLDRLAILSHSTCEPTTYKNLRTTKPEVERSIPSAIICSFVLYSNEFAATISSTTLLFEISFDLNCLSELKFHPSLFPRWL